jgi:hypothetical protein
MEFWKWAMFATACVKMYKKQCVIKGDTGNMAQTVLYCIYWAYSILSPYTSDECKA